MVDGGKSDQISGLITSLCNDYAIPPPKSGDNQPGIFANHRALILGPINTRRLYPSSTIRQAEERLLTLPTANVCIENVWLDRFRISPRSKDSRLLVASLRSSEIVEEKREIYDQLGQFGIKGFSDTKKPVMCSDNSID